LILDDVDTYGIVEPMESATRTPTTMRAGALAAIAGCIVLAACVVVFLNSSQGQAWDDDAMRDVVAGRDTKLTVLSMLGYISIGAIAAVAAVCGVLAVLQSRMAWAVGAVTMIAGANLTTQVLKRSLLERPDLGHGVLNSLPSGHTTVAASAVAATLFVAPHFARSIVALLGSFVVMVTGASTIVAGWHRPSDVIAALAVCLAWAGIVGVFMPGPRGSVTGSTLAALAGAAGGLLFLVAIGVRPTMGWAGFTEASLVLGLIAAATAIFTAACVALSPRS
jgi:membrane-associated phospholipid phosphatase